MRAIPAQYAELLEKGKKGNFSLYFSRMTLWREDLGALKTEYQSTIRHTANGDVPVFDSSIVEMGSRANEILPAGEPDLKAVHARQGGLLNTIAAGGGTVWEFRSRLSSPYISGLGAGHPTETGMLLDRNTGLPYIPASSLKGVLRLAHALDLAERHPELIRKNKDGQVEISDHEPSLRKYFGDTDTSAIQSVRGQLVFLDAYPATVPTIRVDIMNPHFGKYYAGDQGPLETDNPIPIKFLTVKDGIEFIFRCFTSPLAAPKHIEKIPVSRTFSTEDDQAVQEMFSRALCQLGLGGKTSVGYGRFDKPHVLSSDVFQARAIEERLKTKQLQEEAGYPWRKRCLSKIKAATDWGQIKQCMEDQEINRYNTVQEVALAIYDVSTKAREKFRKGWESERDKNIATWLAAAGISWQPLCTQEDPQAIKIEAFKEWGIYLQAKIDLAGLPLTALQKLKEKMRKEWDCDDKKIQKKNPLKKKHLDEVNMLIKKAQEPSLNKDL